MRKSLLISPILLIIATACVGQWRISPGIKISGTFGKDNGPTIGIEMTVLEPLSITQLATYPPSIVFDADYCVYVRFKIHIGAEELLLETGPTMTFDR